MKLCTYKTKIKYIQDTKFIFWPFWSNIIKENIGGEFYMMYSSSKQLGWVLL